MKPLYLTLCLSLAFVACSKPQETKVTPKEVIRPIGTVIQSSGQVYLNGKSAYSNDYLYLTSKMVISNGFAVIALSDFGTIKLFKDTSIGLLKSSNRGGIDLKAGKTWAIIDKMSADNHFDVYTGNAVCGVRGTEFVVSSQKEKSTFAVIKGVVQVENKKGDTLILTNHSQTEVIKDKAPSKPVYYNAEAELGLWEFIVKVVTTLFPPLPPPPTDTKAVKK